MGDNQSLPEQMLSPKQAAKLLGRTIDTLKDWRDRSVGPPFIRYVGRLYYRREDIDAWILANRADTINNSGGDIHQAHGASEVHK